MTSHFLLHRQGLLGKLFWIEPHLFSLGRLEVLERLPLPHLVNDLLPCWLNIASLDHGVDHSLGAI